MDSGLCVGVASTAVQEEGVTLQECGASSKTVWAVDVFDQPIESFFLGYYPLINGSDTNFSQPFVLTYPQSGYPTDKPRPHSADRQPVRLHHRLPADPELPQHRRQPDVGRRLRAVRVRGLT